MTENPYATTQKPICDNAETLAVVGTDVRQCFDALGPRKNLQVPDQVHSTNGVRKDLFGPSIPLRSYLIVARDLAGALENFLKGLQFAGVLLLFHISLFDDPGLP